MAQNGGSRLPAANASARNHHPDDAALAHPAETCAWEEEYAGEAEVGKGQSVRIRAFASYDTAHLKIVEQIRCSLPSVAVIGLSSRLSQDLILRHV